MKIIDLPMKYQINDYHDSIMSQVKALSDVSAVVSIYQIGGLSTPGISDIDLVVVFKDRFRYDVNPKIFNNSDGNYLFTHGLYGVSETNFKYSLKFTFFHNFKLLYGNEIKLKNSFKKSDQQIIKEQIALEFLVKMYINLAVQKKYNTIKLRSLFLHIKALPYDFEFLKINPEKLLNIIKEGINIRNNWLDGSVTKKNVVNWFKLFFKEYELFLIEFFKKYKMQSPFMNFKIAKNINIVNSEVFGFHKKGLVIPDPYNILGSKYFNLLNRLNNFHFKIPITNISSHIIDSYFNYVKEVSIYNKTYLPHFMPLTSSLKVHK